MKKLIYGALFGLLLAVIYIMAGAHTNGAPVLTYVYSNSMEPIIKVNDAFLVWPDSSPEVGDIIMFRPLVLDAPYITHRIIAIGDNGYVTKGDNSPVQDQDNGEPEVVSSRIIGKVVTLQGKPMLVPGLGRFTSYLQGLIGGNAKYLSLFFLLAGVLSTQVGRHKALRRRKPRNRYRLRHVYRWIILIVMVITILSTYLGSRVTQVKYMVSEYPGTLGDQVEVNREGQLVLEVRNNGFYPVWILVDGITPLSIADAPAYLFPQSKERLLLHVLPQRNTGIYQGYVQIYKYPVILPRLWMVKLHSLHPYLAILAVGFTFALIFKLIFLLLNKIHGFEDWIPLKTIKDKLTERRMRRIRAKLLGRRRVRG